jgi:hypothetical protein
LYLVCILVSCVLVSHLLFSLFFFKIFSACPVAKLYGVILHFDFCILHLHYIWQKHYQAYGYGDQGGDEYGGRHNVLYFLNIAVYPGL